MPCPLSSPSACGLCCVCSCRSFLHIERSENWRTLLVQANLPVRGYDVWSALPVHGEFEVGNDKFAIAVLGLLGKMTGACAIESSRFGLTGPHVNVSNGDSGEAEDKIPERQKVAAGRLKIDVQLKALGLLGVWFQCSSEGGREGGSLRSQICC